MSLSAEHEAVLAAAAERILPADERGAGATDAGVVDYLRSLASHPSYRAAEGRLAEGLDLLQELARHRHGADFTRCHGEQRDAILGALQSMPHAAPRRFLLSLIRLTLGGFLCDPHHGGNRDRVGWRLLGLDLVPRAEQGAVQGAAAPAAEVVEEPELDEASLDGPAPGVAIPAASAGVRR